MKPLSKCVAFSSLLPFLVLGMTWYPVDARSAELVSVWGADASEWKDAANPPPGWSFEGELGVAVSDGAEGPRLAIPNEAGYLGTLRVKMPPAAQFGEYVIEFRIGAKTEETGGKLNWYLKKGNWEMRASSREIFLMDSVSREMLRIGEFRPQQIQTIRLVYSVADGTIRSASVDGVETELDPPYPADSLGRAADLCLYMPTPSNGTVLFEGVSLYANESELAELPRWRRPVKPEPLPEGPVVLPTWKPVPDAENIRFVLDPERLKSPAFSRGVLFSQAEFARLGELLDSDPSMRRFWDNVENTARKLLANGKVDLPEDESARLTYEIRYVASLGLLYAATGEPNLGRLLKHLLLDLTSRPMAFWVHSDLRKYDPEWPTGQLETAELARSVALAALWTRDLFSEAEYAELLANLTRKGLDPSLRWIEGQGQRQRNNYLAVIGGGTLVAAIVLEDREGEALAIATLERWLSLIEDDGSYGEPQGYFEYGCSRFLYGWWALGYDRAKELLQDSPLRHSLAWMVYYFVLAEHEGTTSAWRVNFGDDDFLTGPRGRTTFTPIVSESLASIFGDGLGTWISKNLIHSDTPLSLFDFCFRLSRAGAPLPAPVSPEEKGLPLAQSFDNGVVVIRSSWDFANATLFALRSGGASRTEYAHDRPNRNAFLLFAHGDYLAIAPGRSSYRSPLHRSYDIPTITHNTIALDGENQTRDRVAEVVEFVDEPGHVKVVSEARGAYPGDPETVLRTVWYLKALDVFVMEDTVRTPVPRVPSWHLLLSNFRNESKLARLPDGGWNLQRKAANLSFDLQSDTALDLTERPGHMHVGYSYYPGDPFEGPEGSALSLTWRSKSPLSAVRFHSVLAPGKGRDVAALGFSMQEGQIPQWDISRGGNTFKVRIRPDDKGNPGIEVEQASVDAEKPADGTE